MRVLPNHRTIEFDVFAEVKALGSFFEQFLQQRLALDQRQPTYIVAAMKENVESAELQRLRVVARHCRGKRAEIGGAIRAGHHHLAIDNEIATLKLKRLRGNRPVPTGVVMTVAAVERDVLPLTVQLRPEPIFLDFMDPAFAAGWRADLRRTAWFDVTGRAAPGGDDRSPRQYNL